MCAATESHDTADAPETTEQKLDMALHILQEMDRRLIRIETRSVKVMIADGKIDLHGNIIPHKS